MQDILKNEVCICTKVSEDKEKVYQKLSIWHCSGVSHHYTLLFSLFSKVLLTHCRLLLPPAPHAKTQASDRNLKLICH